MQTVAMVTARSNFVCGLWLGLFVTALSNTPCVVVVLQTVAKEHAPSSGEFFRLLSRMLNHAHHYGTAIQGVNKLLEVELNWLLKVRVSDTGLGLVISCVGQGCPQCKIVLIIRQSSLQGEKTPDCNCRTMWCSHLLGVIGHVGCRNSIPTLSQLPSSCPSFCPGSVMEEYFS
jgi:hypothetical protein